MLGGDVETRGYDDYGEEVLASGIPIHQSAVRQPDVYDFDDFAKWKSIATLPAAPFSDSALFAPPLLDTSVSKPSYEFPSCATSSEAAESILDLSSALSNHTRSEWTPLAVTHIVYPTLEAAKEVVSQFLSSLDVLPQVTQQQKCTHHLLTTAQCKMEISIIYFKDIVVEFNLLSGCRTKFNSMFRAFRSKHSPNKNSIPQPSTSATASVSLSEVSVPTLECSEFGADLMREK